MDSKLKLLSDSIGKERFKFNESLKAYTFSKSQGGAECFYIATSVNELVKILDLSNELQIPIFLIGSGTKVLLSSQVKGLVIKNRADNIRIAGVKGKVGREGIGVESALVEADSGASLKKLNQFAKDNKLKEVDGFSSLTSTVGGSIFLDPLLREATQKIKVWFEGENLEIGLEGLKREMVVLSVIFRFKAL